MGSAESVVGTYAEQDHPPFASLGFYDIRMADHGNLAHQGHMPVTDDRIAGADLIISVDGAAARHHNAVVGESAALCDDQVIPAVVLVDVRSFDPFAAGFQAVPDDCPLAFELEGFRIQFTQVDAVMTFVNRVADDIISGCESSAEDVSSSMSWGKFAGWLLHGSNFGGRML